METIDRINEVIQREFNDISPIIFGNNIDSSDIEVIEEDDEECGNCGGFGDGTRDLSKVLCSDCE